MTPPDRPLVTSDDQPRAHLLELVGAIEPCDDQEHTHLKTATHWIAGRSSRLPGAQAGCSGDAPGELLRRPRLVREAAARRAPQGGLVAAGRGHVEPDEDPWAAVVRECREELGIQAVASPITGEHPLFLSVTRTRGHNVHTDVSLWYLLNADANTITSYDQDEFGSIRWLTDEQVLQEPNEVLDPHMRRFVRKVQHAQTRHAHLHRPPRDP